MSSYIYFFPEVYTNGDRPQRRGVRVKEIHSLATPSYGFGWLMSSAELFQELKIRDEPPLKLWLNHFIEMVNPRIFNRWTEKGYYKDCQYSPIIPKAVSIGEDHILIYMACNDTDEMMDKIMADKDYHDECRDSLGNPKLMSMEPSWFRVGLDGMPKGLIIAKTAVTSGVGVQFDSDL